MSDDDGECPHGLDARWCAICKHGVSRTVTRAETDHVIEARYPGRCPRCGTAIDVGDRIGLLDGDWCCTVRCVR